jgi:Leucine-rich repeat (LRR) protein
MKTKFTFFFLAFAVCINVCISVHAQGVNKQDSLALVDLYNSTNGANWYYAFNWLTKEPVSTWVGVIVRNGRVTQLLLDGRNLKGNIPKSFGDLVRLHKLDLSYNQIASIPSTFGKLVHLHKLSLKKNELTSLPAEFGNLKQLEYLSLSRNKIKMLTPEFFNLTSLRKLNLAYNKLTHLPPALGNFISLETLEGENNLLSTLPSTLGNLTNLQTLDLSFNQLTSLPPELKNLTNLRALYLYSNQLTRLPLELENLNGLLHLDVRYNELTFDDLEEFEKLFTSFYYSSQANIPLHQNGNTLFVLAGGTLTNNTYEWYKNGLLDTTIVADSTYIPEVRGNYSVSVTNKIATQLTLYSNTIYYERSAIVASPENGWHQFGKAISFSAYPNPAKNVLNIQLNYKATFTLTNQSGNILLTKIIDGNGMINVSALPAGLYYLKNTATGEVKKVVIER